MTGNTIDFNIFTQRIKILELAENAIKSGKDYMYYPFENRHVGFLLSFSMFVDATKYKPGRLCYKDEIGFFKLFINGSYKEVSVVVSPQSEEDEINLMIDLL